MRSEGKMIQDPGSYYHRFESYCEPCRPFFSLYTFPRSRRIRPSYVCSSRICTLSFVHWAWWWMQWIPWLVYTAWVNWTSIIHGTASAFLMYGRISSTFPPSLWSVKCVLLRKVLSHNALGRGGACSPGLRCQHCHGPSFGLSADFLYR